MDERLDTTLCLGSAAMPLRIQNGRSHPWAPTTACRIAFFGLPFHNSVLLLIHIGTKAATSRRHSK